MMCSITARRKSKKLNLPLEKPVHIALVQQDERQLMMRIFFSTMSEGAFCLEDNLITGLILRDDVSRALSDLSAKGLPIRKLLKSEDIQRFFPVYAFEENDQTLALVVSRQAEMIGKFTLPELLKISTVEQSKPEPVVKEETRPKIKPVIKLPPDFHPPKNVTEEEFAHLTAPLQEETDIKEKSIVDEDELENETEIQENHETESQAEQDDEVEQIKPAVARVYIPPAAKIITQAAEDLSIEQLPVPETIPHTTQKEITPSSIQRKFIGEGSDSRFKASVRKVRSDLERAKLVTSTLEALSIPLIALDMDGDDLFFNDEWVKLRSRYPGKIENIILLTTAKEKMMMRAMEGGLEHDETIDIRGILRSRVIKVRPIRPDSEDVMPAGYLFWLEPAPLDNHQYPGTEKNAATYSGRTLPEILEDEERRALIWAMEQAGGNQSNAAMLLGIPRQTFSYKWKKLSRAR